jgi:iron complex outermembrane receptor protein
VKSALGIVYTTGSPADAGDPAPTLFGRASYATREHLNNWTFDNQLTGKLDTGAIHHNLLFGIDRQVAHSAELFAFGSATPIDVFHPVYGTMPTPITPADVPDAFSGDLKTRQRQTGIYAQDQMSIGRLRLTLSGRQDWAQQESDSQQQDDRKFTWRVGALYLTPIGLAPYVSYSTSFEPQSAQLQDGSLAKPSLGRQIEAGTKYQVPGTNILVTGAWFRIEQTNVVVSDPVTFLSSQLGKVRSEGIEVEASGTLAHDFNVKVAFSRQRVKNVQDVNPANVGKSLATVGRGGVSANLEWAPQSGPARGFAIGGAVRHVDGVYADVYVDGVARYTPAYTVFDALMRYDLGRLSPRLDGVSLAVNATNLFDKTYLTSCYANYAWCWYGNRRTVQGTVNVRW